MILRSRDLWPVLAVTFALAGCVKPANESDKAAKDKPSDAAPAQPEPSADILTLAVAKIMRAGHEDRAFELAANGTVTLAGIPFGTISSDGQLLNPDGELMMAVQPDGSVIAGDGPTGIVLDETGGSLTLPNKLSVKVQFGPDGAITTETSGPNAVLLGTEPPQLLSQGCTGPVTKTCALITLSYLMALGNPDSVQDDAAP